MRGDSYNRNLPAIHADRMQDWRYSSLAMLAIVAALTLQIAPARAEKPTLRAPNVLAQNSATSPIQNSAQAPPTVSQQQPLAGAAVPTPYVQVPLTPEEQGDALMGQQRYQAAIEAYRQAPHRSADSWNKMGIAYQLMFNLVDASHCYQASLKLDAKNPRVMNNLATIYDTQKEYSDAERLYHKALKIDPKSPLIQKNLGTNLLAQHKYEKGWQAYQAALKLDPGIFTDSTSPRVQNPTSAEDRGAMNYYMARGCVRAGMNDCAIDYLRRALNEGFTNAKKIQADNEFASLRGVAAFQELIAEQRQQ